MYDVMQGVRVIEVAEHTFVPAASMVLADWGADVIKIERPQGGDAARNLRILQRPGQVFNEYFEVANRGKRSVALDLTSPQGQAVLLKLIEKADVFITNLRGDARKKLGIDADEIMALNPRLIYARGTGYGVQGPMAQDGGFDYPSAWCRSGSGYVQTPADGEPPMQPGSVGDLLGGATLAGAISAALFRRERTGKGAVVDNALYLVGSYIMTQSITGASLGGGRGPATPRSQSGDALVNNYRTADNRWLNICFLQDAWWPDLAHHLGRPDLALDARFNSGAARLQNRSALIDELDAVFATRTLAEWKLALKTLKGVWAPLQTPNEVLEDEQALANGFVTKVSRADGAAYMSVSSPAQFDQRAIGDLRASPEFAVHTQEVMAEAGLKPDEIDKLRADGVIV